MFNAEDGLLLTRSQINGPRAHLTPGALFPIDLELHVGYPN